MVITKLTRAQREYVTNSFARKLHGESWFDRPTVLHGEYLRCFQVVMHWEKTGEFSEGELPIIGIVCKMLKKHIAEVVG